MEVRLMGSTMPVGEEAPSLIAGMAAAVCTNSDSEMSSLKGAMRCGHESVLQHVSFTFLITGVSRAFLAQITRHRIASFSVQSQRYVNMANNGVIVPPSIEQNESAVLMYEKACTMLNEVYKAFIAMGIPQQDARFVLPQGTETQMVMTMNVRQLRHFLGLRMCNRAQWEIREAADKIYTIIKDIDPVLVQGAGPGCWNGKCPQGKMSCGHPKERI